MKTIVIWDTCGDNPISFFILEGNYAHLNNVYCNSFRESDEAYEAYNALVDELYSLVFAEDGAFRLEALDTFPIEVITDMYGKLNMATVIVAGCVP